MKSLITWAYTEEISINLNTIRKSAITGSLWLLRGMCVILPNGDAAAHPLKFVLEHCNTPAARLPGAAGQGPGNRYTIGIQSIQMLYLTVYKIYNVGFHNQ